MRKHNNGFMQANNRRKQKHIQVIFGAFFFSWDVLFGDFSCV